MPRFRGKPIPEPIPSTTAATARRANRIPVRALGRAGHLPVQKTPTYNSPRGFRSERVFLLEFASEHAFSRRTASLRHGRRITSEPAGEALGLHPNLGSDLGKR